MELQEHHYRLGGPAESLRDGQEAWGLDLGTVSHLNVG